MEFLKRFLRNLFLLLVIGIVLYVVSPGIFNQVAEVYGLLFGPVIVVFLIIAAALPRRS